MFDTIENSKERLNRAEYRDKVLGCWNGKNIGGTLGAPFEGGQSMNVVTFYTQDLQGRPAPNDDLDLQLIWLIAAEEQGLYHLNERILGEYWLNYIIHPAGEYGVCKANMKNGLTPPLSGSCNNDEFKWSNGAWIRSELWACLFPGSPDEAAQFAYYDACVDHCGEGIYAEVFTTTLESAAFAENDLRRLLEIGLAHVPKDCRVAQSVRLACECYDAHRSFAEARDAIVRANADLGWFQAPANLGFMVLGLLYGEGDFGRTVSLAVNCGDDTDCTAATAGAILGIRLGLSRLPAKWLEPIGETIESCSFATIPERPFLPPARTIAELSGRVMRLAAAAQFENPTLPQFTDGPTCFHDEYRKTFLDSAAVRQRVWRRSPTELSFDLPFGTFTADFLDGIYAEPGKPLRVKFGAVHLHCIETLIAAKPRLPEGWNAQGSGECIFINRYNSSNGVTLTIIPAEFSGLYCYVPVEIRLSDRFCKWTVDLPFQKKGAVRYTFNDPEYCVADSAYFDARNRFLARGKRSD